MAIIHGWVIGGKMEFPAESKKKYTYKDYLKTPEGAKYQLIEGELIMTPSPSVYHQAISRDLGFALLEFTRKNNLDQIFLAPCDVYLDDENVFQPDILFITKEREREVITKQQIKEAPNLVIEILSPTTAYYDLVKKKKIYAQFGVKEYWVVEPEEKTVDIYRLKNKSYEQYKTFEEKDTLISPLITDLRLDLAQVFQQKLAD